MDFRLTPEQEAFRSELRAWLDRSAVEVFGEYGAPRFHANDEEWARLMDWHRRLYRAGYIALAWPKEWGGAGASLVEQIVYQDEMSKRGLPPVVDSNVERPLAHRPQCTGHQHEPEPHEPARIEARDLPDEKHSGQRAEAPR